MIITDAGPQHFADILALNDESVHFLTALTPDRLSYLHEQSACHRVALAGARVAGFLLAFAPHADYDSVNYRWFAARYNEFFYIDRVVVAPAFRGQGVGALLYQDVFATARHLGFRQVVCEFDIDPPNPVSAAFHRRFGFREVGTQRVAGGAKRVSLQSAPVPPYERRSDERTP